MALNEKNKYERPEDIKVRQFKQIVIVVFLLIILIFLTVLSESGNKQEYYEIDTSSESYQEFLEYYNNMNEVPSYEEFSGEDALVKTPDIIENGSGNPSGNNSVEIESGNAE
jgi:hypothetical protein